MANNLRGKESKEIMSAPQKIIAAEIFTLLSERFIANTQSLVIKAGLKKVLELINTLESTDDEGKNTNANSGIKACEGSVTVPHIAPKRNRTKRDSSGTIERPCKDNARGKDNHNERRKNATGRKDVGCKGKR